MIFEPRDYQADAIASGLEFLRTTEVGKNGLLVEPTGCHARGTLILMFDGSCKAVEDVAEGDLLMGPDSNPRSVLALCRGREMLHRITPHRGGKPFVVNESHVLSLICTNEGYRVGVPSRKTGQEVDNVTIRDYLKKAPTWRHVRKIYRAGIVRFNTKRKTIVDPWLLGVLLGDGCFRNGHVSITTADNEIADGVEKCVALIGMRTRREGKEKNKAIALHIVKEGARNKRPNPFVCKIKSLGLMELGSGEKFIPNSYKTGSVKVRRQVLAGLIDTDGHYCKGFDYITKSDQLACDVSFVARSLGLTVSSSREYKKCQTGAGGWFSRLHISGDLSSIPCRVKRKKAGKRLQKKRSNVTGFKMEQAGEGDFFGFRIDKDNLYLTADFTVHHNSGKSIVIANIVAKLDGPAVVFQPTQEILSQNLGKLQSYGYNPGIYSASMGERSIRKITLATIGSVVRKPDLFSQFKYAIVDEAHSTNAKGGMYADFFEHNSQMKLLGLTATPYRLVTDGYGGSILKFLTRTRPRLFHKVVHVTQNRTLYDRGYWARLEYKQVKTGFRPDRLRLNSTGADYTDESVKQHFAELNFSDQIVRCVRRLDDLKRGPVLVFTRFVEEAMYVASRIANACVVTAETPAADRAMIVRGFREGRIPCVCNVGVLAVGFDYPALANVIVARPTRSLALWYQMAGRCCRPHPSKAVSYIVDMVGLVEEFGRIEDFELVEGTHETWFLRSDGKARTNVYFGAPPPQRFGIGRTEPLPV